MGLVNPERKTYRKFPSFLSTLIWVIMMGATTPLFAQVIDLEREVLLDQECDQYSVSLEVGVNPPPVPKEVVLLIDRSGSMGLEIPGDVNEPMDYAKEAAIGFIEGLFAPENNPTGLNRVAVISYSIYAWLDYGFADASQKDDIIASIEGLFASGGTNISKASHAARELILGGISQDDIYNDIDLVPGDLDGATFDCEVSRSVLLLTDGVTNRRFLNNIPCTSNPRPPFPQNATACMLDAIDAGQALWSISMDGVQYEQSVFGIGLVGALYPNAREAATFTLEAIQNKGLSITDDASELQSIYQQILSELALPGSEAMLTEKLPAGLDLVPGSLQPQQASYDSQSRTISWDIGDLEQDNYTLDYAVTSNASTQCGDLQFDQGVLDYTDYQCQQVNANFPNVSVCVPCLDIGSIEMEQVNCDPSVNYQAEIDTSGCVPESLEILWELFLNGEDIASINGDEIDDLQGSFTYGHGDFSGELLARLTVQAQFEACYSLQQQSEFVLALKEAPSPPVSSGDQYACWAEGVEPLIAQVELEEGMEVHWFTSATGGEEIIEPDLSEIGQVTYYAEASDPLTGCTSLERTPVILEYASCGMVLSKEAPAMDSVDCNPLEVGDPVVFTFTLINSGSAPIGQVDLSDPLLSDEPLVGPQSGDQDGDGVLDAGEVWLYQASYALTPEDKEEGQVVNVATARGTVFQTNGDLILETTGNTAFPVCNAPGIEILKSSSLAGEDCKTLMVGDQVPYHFEVTNTGDLPLTGIRIIDPLLDEPELVYQEDEGVLYPGRVWVVDAVITIRQQHIDEGGIWNTAQVLAESALGPVEDTSKTVEVLLCQEGELALLKEAHWGAGVACGQVGDRLLYQFELLNTGNTVLENIRINDPLLGGDLDGPVSGDIDEDGKLDVDELWVYSATYTLGQDDLDRGWVENQALALASTGSGLEVLDRSGTTFDNDLPTISQVCTASGIGLVQAIELIDSNQNGCADEGETLWFEFKIKNMGTTTLFDVIVSEPTLDISGELPELAPGAMDELSFYGSYVISGTDLENGLLTFSSQVTAEDTRGVKWTDRSHPESFSEDAASDFSSFCQGQSGSARMELALTGEWMDDNGDGNSQEGETVRFLAEIRNTGEVPIFSIGLYEEQPNGLEISGESIEVLQPGEMDSLSFEVTYIIGMADLEEGEVVARLLAAGVTSEGDTIEVLSDDPTDDTNMDSDGDGLPDDPTRVVLPRVLAESEVSDEIPFEIFNGISPDGDGLNDYMQINGIENYPQNNFKVFNRWGVQVFEINGYDNVSKRFEGISEGRTTIRQGERLPAGTYYYVLTFSGDNPGQQAYTGYLYINRN